MLAAWLLGGCASDPFRALPPGAYTERVELTSTPFFPQQEYQCGPAALATVLSHSGVAVEPDELTPAVFVPGRRGSFQAEMIAAARRYERLPYVIAPEFTALLAELEGGRPVLVLQNLGVGWRPAWHYAVAVGFSAAEGEIVLRSGTDERRLTDAGVFANTWERSGNWGVVLLRPGELPADPDRGRFLSAAAAAESAGRLQLAAAAYAAALERWPDSALAMLGLGNTAYRRGELAAAEQWYRRALAAEPGDVLTLNNLAAVVAGQGRCTEGGVLIRRAIDLAGSEGATAALLAETESEIAACR